MNPAFLREALDLARRGRGQTSPNPMVGAVLVCAGEVVGRGFHTYGGMKHAEVHALEEAGARARGATLYINLEPCSHSGRTGPCADALIAAGVSRVVGAMQDPNPQVAGEGFRRLRTAGIDVEMASEFTVEAEGQTFRAGFALASRVRNYGGDLEIARGASLLDDQFELVLFEGSSSFTYLRYMLGVAVHRHTHMRGVTTLRTRQAVFSASAAGKIHLQVDGELAGFAPARVEIVPNALTVLVPQQFRARSSNGASDPVAAWTTSPTR